MTEPKETSERVQRFLEQQRNRRPDSDSNRENEEIRRLEERLEEQQKEIEARDVEIAALKAPPYLTGTVINIGEEHAKISVDGQGTFEIPVESVKVSGAEVGVKVILNRENLAVLEHSEFPESNGELAIAEEILDNKRLKALVKGETHIVFYNPEKGEIKAGDDLLLDGSKSLVLESFKKRGNKHGLEEVEDMPWTKIGGLESTIQSIREEIENPLLHKDVYAKYGRKPIKGALLYGPPGCGKTMLAKAIAYNLSRLFVEEGKEVKGHFLKVDGPEILDKFVGNSEANIRRLYATAREVSEEDETPVVVFIDEAEAILKGRGTGISTDVYDSIVPQFLAEMDGLNGQANILTLLATNREDILDPAVLRDGRIDRRIKIPRPSQVGAEQIFNIYLKDKPLEKIKEDLDQIETAKAFSGMLTEAIYDRNNIAYSVVAPAKGETAVFRYSNLISGAMIKGIVDRAVSYAISREISEKGENYVTLKDLERATNEEFLAHKGFHQSIVKSDWEDVFGVGKGKQLEELCKSGQIVLESKFSEDIFAGRT